jgi:ferrous iron transport protein B
MLSPLRIEKPPAAAGTVVVGIAGQPNVGKSTIFNMLTGLHQHVGNWPGKTVERKDGDLVHDGVTLHLVDLPGTRGLTAHSFEERIARDFIIEDRPQIVVMVADATALERSLYLLAELLILPVPVVLVLNMMDVAEANGITIEPHVLEAALGLPVIPVVATRNEGFVQLLDAIVGLVREPARFHPSRPQIAEAHRPIVEQLDGLLGESIPPPFEKSWIALKLLEGDPDVMIRVKGWLGDEGWPAVEALLHRHEDAVLDVVGGRYDWIARMIRAAVVQPEGNRFLLTDRIDRIALHPLGGMLVLLTAFAGVFLVTFTLATPVQAWLELAVVEPLRLASRQLFADTPVLAALVGDGLLGGAGIVMTFLPVLIVFFAALALLEDTGYFARAAFVMDRFMHALGLHGRSFLPLFLGFGCNVPAVMGARVVESRGGRLLTILLIPLVPCSARLAVLAFLTPVFFGSAALPVALGLVALNLIVLAVVGIMLSRTLFRSERSAFIMELPQYHAPTVRSIGAFVWLNTWAFVRKAGSFILLASVIIWALSYFPDGRLDHSLLASAGQFLAPLGSLMGLDWRLLVALIFSFIAKENAIATLGVLFGGGGLGLTHSLAAHVAPASALAFLTVTMLFIPCLATVATMRAEAGWRWTLFDVLVLLLVSLIGGVLVYQGAVALGLEG